MFLSPSRVRLGVLALFLVCWPGAFVACGGTSAPTPTHVVAVFVDGFDHGDYRQACAVTFTGKQPMSACEAFYAGVAAQAYFYGVWGGYHVVAHSVKEWRQQYHGRTVELATVKFRYTPHGGNQALTAHLVKIRGAWKIAYIQ